MAIEPNNHNGSGIETIDSTDADVSEKTVTLRGYSRNDYADEDSDRDFVADFVPEMYVEEVYRRVTHTRSEDTVVFFGDEYESDELGIGFSRDLKEMVEESSMRLEDVIDADDLHGIGESVLVAISNHIEANDALIRFEEEEEEYETYNKSPRQVVADYAGDLMQSGYGSAFEQTGYTDTRLNSVCEDSEATLSLRSSVQDQPKVLKHRGERDENNTYEIEGGSPVHASHSIDWTVEARDISNDDEAAHVDDFIESVYRLLVSNPAIGRVRVTSCEVTKSGDCYDI